MANTTALVVVDPAAAIAASAHETSALISMLLLGCITVLRVLAIDNSFDYNFEPYWPLDRHVTVRFVVAWNLFGTLLLSLSGWIVFFAEARQLHPAVTSTAFFALLNVWQLVDIAWRDQLAGHHFGASASLAFVDWAIVFALCILGIILNPATTSLLCVCVAWTLLALLFNCYLAYKAFVEAEERERRRRRHDVIGGYLQGRAAWVRGDRLRAQPEEVLDAPGVPEEAQPEEHPVAEPPVDPPAYADVAGGPGDDE